MSCNYYNCFTRWRHKKNHRTHVHSVALIWSKTGRRFNVSILSEYYLRINHRAHIHNLNLKAYRLNTHMRARSFNLLHIVIKYIHSHKYMLWICVSETGRRQRIIFSIRMKRLSMYIRERNTCITWICTHTYTYTINVCNVEMITRRTSYPEQNTTGIIYEIFIYIIINARV